MKDFRFSAFHFCDVPGACCTLERFRLIRKKYCVLFFTKIELCLSKLKEYSRVDCLIKYHLEFIECMHVITSNQDSLQKRKPKI
jgi:hypothetical protein